MINFSYALNMKLVKKMRDKIKIFYECKYNRTKAE